MLGFVWLLLLLPPSAMVLLSMSVVDAAESDAGVRTDFFIERMKHCVSQYGICDASQTYSTSNAFLQQVQANTKSLKFPIISTLREERERKKKEDKLNDIKFPRIQRERKKLVKTQKKNPHFKTLSYRNKRNAKISQELVRTLRLISVCYNQHNAD